MVELNKIEKRAIVLVLAAVLAVVWVRWHQAEQTRVALHPVSEEATDVQR